VRKASWRSEQGSREWDRDSRHRKQLEQGCGGEHLHGVCWMQVCREAGTVGGASQGVRSGGCGEDPVLGGGMNSVDQEGSAGFEESACAQ
jgi:hypothetical protein